MMNDDSFARLIAEEVKNRATQEQLDYLNLPENWERWQQGLSILVETLDSQIVELEDREGIERKRYEALGKDGIKLLAEMLADVDARRKKTIRFRHYVERRLEAVRRMADGQSEVIEERARLVEFLRGAIERHRGMMTQTNLEPSPVDLALWGALSGRWEFDEVDLVALEEDDEE